MPEHPPAIVAASDDATIRATVARELTTRYGADYTTTSVTMEEARSTLAEYAREQTPVALVLADHRSGGTALLAEVRHHHAHTKRALLLRWGENRGAREAIVAAVGSGQADYFIAEPMASPDERFHRAVVEFLDEWWRLEGLPFEAVRVVGDERSPRVHEICDLLQRHDFPYRFFDASSDDGRTCLQDAGVASDGGPVVILRDGRALIDPTNVEVAEAVGARTRPGSGVYDIVIIGGGPAGLSVAVYAASEGLRVALIEGVALGGQAGTSSLIRNYLGFPRGISGAELATRAVDQAILFGTEMVYGTNAVALELTGADHIVRLADGAAVPSRTVVIATGVTYRTLDVPALEPYQGVGVFYGAAMSEARALAGEHVFVVGGGNSGGQAAMYLAHFARQVTILVRSHTLARSMSDYLVKAIDAQPNIDVRYDIEVVGGGGDTRLTWLELEDRRTGAATRTEAAALFVLIGATPHTTWLPPEVPRDEWGYVITGAESDEPSRRAGDRAITDLGDGHMPLLFETNVPRVFAVGDVRRGSIKRVASAAGEGAICVRLIHDALDAYNRTT